MLGAVAVAVPCLAQYDEYEAIILHSGRIPFAESFGTGIGDGQQVGKTTVFQNGGHALLWSGSPESFVDLHPAGFDTSQALGASGGRQVGIREIWQPEFQQYATLWSGTASSWVNLHPASYIRSRALGISGDQQVGNAHFASGPLDIHALLWRGSASSVVNLNPVGYYASNSFATDGYQQVGWAIRPGGPDGAALWTGTAESFVDLSLPGYTGTHAFGVAGGQQVGRGSFNGNGHALLWFGSPNGYVDLNPGPNDQWGSSARATNGIQQVGYAARSDQFFRHAFRWSGSPESYLDLHQFLPPEYQGLGGYSVATGIDAEGNIIGYARRTAGLRRAVMWRPVPEPVTGLVLTAGIALLLWRRRMR